jgi:hypothetical protein
MLPVQDVVERSREKSSTLQGFGDAVLRAEALEDQLVKSQEHAAAMQSKLDAAFAKYRNDIQEMQAKGDDLVRKNKSLRYKNKGTPAGLLSTCWRSRGSLTRCALLFAELENRVEQLKTSETDLKNLFYREQEARQVLELDYKELAYVNHLAKSIPDQVLAFMKSYFPKAPVDVVAGGLAANCSNEQYAELLEQMAPIAEQVADKLNLQ